MPLEVIRFSPNCPVVVQIESYGTATVSKFSHADQFFYRVAGQRSMYLHPICHQKLTAQGVKPGDTVRVCKRELKPGDGSSIIWDAQVETRGSDAAPSNEGPKQEVTRKPQAAVELLDRVQSIDGEPDGSLHKE